MVGGLRQIGWRNGETWQDEISLQEARDTITPFFLRSRSRLVHCYEL